MAQMAYEVLVRSWRPMTLLELVASIRELCAASIRPEHLKQAITEDGRFTFDGQLFALDEFNWRTPGDFSYIDPSCFA